MLRRLSRVADRTKDKEWLLRAAREIFDRAMGAVDVHTSDDETSTFQAEYPTREALVAALKEQGFVDADELVPPPIIEDTVTDGGK